ncbi:MAG: DUF72 domain-containing protein [Candidatus Eisenbacteria bacterium]|uniref:DUF72 domain-containing protein n=1 Tax=Eiseniibacteriota bacterium TaxID=2212470 RepID=A0A956M0B7_UNCEI|nr:DUF72 domain-containing protein [Candidatus Eisenbacteria bacterium]
MIRPVELDQSFLPAGVHLGTSSFSSEDWIGGFYPVGAKPADFLSHYAMRFHTVEIDATWHVVPSIRTFEAWARKAPPGFIFSLKVPKSVTHEKYLVGCEDEWREFLDLCDVLGEHRGPLLFQFPYVSRNRDPHEWETGEDFLRRLEAFLPLLPERGRYAIEVRNESWVGQPLLDLLRSRNVALTLVEYFTMPSGPELLRRMDPITADFAYIRFLGHHREMDLMVAEAREEGRRRGDWDSVLIDREAETRPWIAAVQSLLGRGRETFVYFNNHYAGFAPGSIELFLRLWQEETRSRTSSHEM